MYVSPFPIINSLRGTHTMSKICGYSAAFKLYAVECAEKKLKPVAARRLGVASGVFG